MSSPWLLLLGGGVTIGALFGMFGVVFWTAGVACAAITGERRAGLIMVGVAILGSSIGAVRISLDAEDSLTPLVLESEIAEVTVRTVPQSGPSGLRAVVRVDQVAIGDGKWQDASGDVLVLFRNTAPNGLAKGDRLRIRWSLAGVDESTFGNFVRSSGAGASARVTDVNVLSRGKSMFGVVSRARELVTQRITESIPGDAGALMAGFVTGDDSNLSDSAQDAFARTGMSHITAVSGSNVAVLLTIWSFFVPTGRMRRSPPALLGVVLVVWLYVLLVGMGPGAVRAGLLATIMLPAARMGRRADPLTALALASAIMLLVQPGFARSVGFWLSMAASTAIVASVDRHAKSRAALAISGAVALIAAQVATLPIIVWTFGGWSPASVIANLIVGPMVAAVFPFAFGLALIATILPWVGDLVGWPLAIVADVIISIVESIARESSMLRLGHDSMPAVSLITVLSCAMISLLSTDMRRWLTRVAWRFPAVNRSAAAVVIGIGLGVWVTVMARLVW